MLVRADKSASFFVGDAAGRPGDISGGADSDRCSFHLPFPLSTVAAKCCRARSLQQEVVERKLLIARRKFAENVGIAFKTPEEVFG